ncbi:MAG: NAD(P)H-quinone oxidoreductase [Chlamydiae bacterium]|nr:NAD(P)H-quinone oxidoreductase [Chlamydiota bacterium]
MRAIVENLTFIKEKTRELGAKEILLRTHAFSVNHMDILQRKGKYPLPPHFSKVLGVDAAGVVEKTGELVTRFKKGDRVMSLLDGGGYAEYAIAQEDLTLPIPENFNYPDAAAVLEVFLTAYQTLFQIGEISPSQWILIHAGASGIGSAAIQLVREAGAVPITTASSSEKMEFCLKLGAHGVINHTEGSISQKILQITENHGIDLILDCFGASFFKENIQSLAKGGCLILIATLGGFQLKEWDLRLLFEKWATVTATTLRLRSVEYKAKLMKEFSQFCLPRFEKGVLKPVIFKTLPWEKIAEAHQLIESRKVMGKIVMKII